MAKVEKAIVAKGRTVRIEAKHYGPGEEVSLPAEEINTLRQLGYLVDPQAKEIPAGSGPTFNSKDGPSVQAAS